jgi:hypothetical protein
MQCDTQHTYVYNTYLYYLDTAHVNRSVVNLVVKAYLPARALFFFVLWCVQSVSSRLLTELEAATPLGGVTLGGDSETQDPESGSNKNFFSYASPRQKRVISTQALNYTRVCVSALARTHTHTHTHLT